MASPLVFISSTSEDLKEYRAAAKDAAVAERFLVDMQEYFPARDNPPLRECLERVDRADLVVVLVAERYGWIPKDQTPGESKSITWLECLQAADASPRKDVLAFLVAKDAQWPEALKDSYRAAKAVEDDESDEVIAAVRRDVKGLKEFKAWLNSRAIRAEFVNPHDLKGKVGAALRKWRDDHPDAGAGPVVVEPPAPRAADPNPYLDYLRRDTAHIEIRGLAVREGNANLVPIEELYVTLKDERGHSGEDRGRQPLDHALANPRLVILGDPGSGKSTFLRHVAHAASAKRMADGAAPFPLLVRVGELAQFLREPKLEGREQPQSADAPAWLPLFLAKQSVDNTVPLPAQFFREVLHQGPALLLIDGLDEAPTEESRQTVSRLLEKAAQAWTGTRIAVTTRPQAFDGEVMLRGFHQAEVAPLDREAIAEFLKLWSGALFREDAARAEKHARELLGQIESRIDIRRIASNPVMLTALAVLQWNEKRMPDHRADLYRSVIEWLASQRKDAGQPSAEQCIGYLQELAGAMQGGAAGRRVQMPVEEAAEVLRERFRDVSPEARGERALEFLKREQVDSGIVVNRGGELRFWHLTFREFLTARLLAGMDDSERHALLFRDGLAWKPEWREVVLLLAGLLLDKRVDRLDALVSAALDDLYGSSLARRVVLSLGIQPPFLEQARVGILVGLLQRDLSARKYKASDPRCQRVVDSVMDIFDAEKAARIPVRVRLEVAEALGQIGDPRLRLPSQEDYWVTIPGAGFQIGRYPVTVLEYAKFVAAGGEAPENWEEQVQFFNRSDLERHRYGSGYSTEPKSPIASEALHSAALRSRLFTVTHSARDSIAPSPSRWPSAIRGNGSSDMGQPEPREPAALRETRSHAWTEPGALPDLRMDHIRAA